MRPAPKPTISTFAPALLATPSKVSVLSRKRSPKTPRLPPRMRVSPRHTHTGRVLFDADRADLLVKMRAAAEKAIQLDPLLAEAHDALGMAYARDGQWEQSEKSFRRAIELDPSRSESYDDLAMYLLLPLGRIEEAVHQMHIAEKTDPLSPEVHIGYGLRAPFGWPIRRSGRSLPQGAGLS